MKHSLLSRTILCLSVCAAQSCLGDNLILEANPLAPTPHEQRDNSPRAEVFADRAAYWNDDGQGQFLAVFFGLNTNVVASQVRLELMGAASNVVARREVTLGTNSIPKVSFFVNTDALKPGGYEMRAALLGADGSTVTNALPGRFVRANRSHPRTSIPGGGIPLLVHGQTNVPNAIWPITTGIPFPFGAIADTSRLQLLENGKPVPAQWVVRSTWTPGKPRSVKWAGLDFLARYDGGKPRAYRIVARGGKPPSTPSIKTTETPDLIEVDTGIIRFQVNRKRFSGVEAAWIGDQKVIQQGDSVAGPFLRDERGALFQAADDSQAEVGIEEAGPVRVTILARGWYANKQAGQKLCQFVTRITAHAGQPSLTVNHRTIITFDSRSNKVGNVSFAVPMVGATTWATSVDGGPAHGNLPGWVHQERSDKARLNDLEAGKRADGWLSVSSDRATVTGFLRDIWQRFPKELEADGEGLKFHFWPRHGRRAFAEAEELDKRNIYKAWFAHQGSLLDLQMPKNYFDQLQAWHAKDGWDPEHTSEIGYMATAEGVAIGSEFEILLQPGPPRADELTARARLFQQNPHAIAAPSWNASTLALGHLAARDDKRWPEVEEVLNESYPRGMFNTVNFLGDYGMWIYGNTHNPWDNTQPRLHRAWQNSHYQHVGNNWLLYFRGGSPDLLRWARASTDNYMDVGTVNYHNPERPLKARITGAMYHAKGFVPWGSRHYGMFKFDSDVWIWGHWVDPDAHLWRHYVEGNGRSRDLYRAWAAALRENKVAPLGAGREASNTLGMMLNYYTATWDPQAILWIHDLTSGMMSVPFEKFPHPPSFPLWHKTWLDRYYDLTRDQRVVGAITNYIAAGFDHLAPNAFAYRVTGDAKFLAPLVPSINTSVHTVYHNPEDELDCFASYHNAVSTTWLPQVPFALRGMAAAKLTFPHPPEGGAPYYLVGSSHLYSQTQRNEIALTVLALDPDDREFRITVGPLERSMHPADLIVVSPSGKIVHESGELRPTNDTTNVRLITIPKDGERGVYAIELFGHQPVFRAPLTDLPHEITRPTKGNSVRGFHAQNGFFCLPPRSSATLTFTALGYSTIPGGNYICIQDAAGKMLLDTSLLVIGKWKKASVELTSGDAVQAWRFYCAGDAGPALAWSGGAAALYIGRRSEDFAPILHALPAATKRAD